jgi:hypothetical protein
VRRRIIRLTKAARLRSLPVVTPASVSLDVVPVLWKVTKSQAGTALFAAVNL